MTRGPGLLFTLLLPALLTMGCGPSRPPLVVPRADSRPPPTFELRAIGHLGGDGDEYLSCWLLGAPGGPPLLMLDGGSVTGGMRRWLELEGRLSPDATPSEVARAVKGKLASVRGLLLTHAHLDHWAGAVAKSTLDLALAFEGRESLQVVGLPSTIDAVRTQLLAPPLWADFTSIPKERPALLPRALPPGERLELAGYVVETVKVAHPVESAAFLLFRGEEAFLHVGDTGLTEEVWQRAGTLLRAGHLRGLALEASFAAHDEPLAVKTGHLTRGSFLLSLGRMAGLDGLPADALGLDAATSEALARRLAPVLGGLPIVVTHLKALAHDEVVAEFAPLQRAGLQLLFLQPGQAVRL